MKASSEHNRDDSAAEDEAVLESELNDLFSEEEEDGDVVANVKTPTCDYDMDPRLVEHIHAAHGLEPQGYRRTTQRLDLSISPQPVAPQTVRTVTYAYKRALCEEDYTYDHCASCARSKRRTKLTAIFFPPRGTLAMPAWLGWTSSQWEAHGTLWYDAVDAALSANTYLETYFQAGDRVKRADRELVDAEVRYRRTCQKGEADDVLDDIEDAKIWAKRVSQWGAIYMLTLSTTACPLLRQMGSVGCCTFLGNRFRSDLAIFTVRCAELVWKRFNGIAWTRRE